MKEHKRIILNQIYSLQLKMASLYTAERWYWYRKSIH